MGQRLIVPPKLETEVLTQYRAYINVQLDKLDDSIAKSDNFATNPHDVISESLRVVTSIRDNSARSLREWAIQWYLVGATVQQIASTVNMSWNTIDKWIKEYEKANNIQLNRQS